jgi:hypothetical protein
VAGRTGARGWGRLVWRIGGPLAAAASIVLIVTVGAPVFDGRPVSTPHTVVGGAQWAAPKPVQENLKKLAMTKLDPQAEAELKNTPEMKALTFLEVLLNPVVEGTRNAVAGTRQSYEDAQLLVRYLFAGANERLVAEYRQKYPEIPLQEAVRAISDLDILKSALKPDPPAVEPSNTEAAPSPPALSSALASPDAI